MVEYYEFLFSLGANDIRLIKANTIITAPWIFYKCQYGCAQYGKSVYCPPYSPGHKQTREIIDSYETAIIFRCNNIDSIPDIAVQAVTKLFSDGYHKALAFGNNACRIHGACDSGESSPHQAGIPSMAACGIDVFQTVRNNDFEISTLEDEGVTQNHFALLLVM